jgi:hypothetical protein
MVAIVFISVVLFLVQVFSNILKEFIKWLKLNMNLRELANRLASLANYNFHFSIISAYTFNLDLILSFSSLDSQN